MSGIVLVGVDGSETATKAAEKAAGLASGLGYELHVLSAYTGEDVPSLSVGYSHSRVRVAEEIAAHDEKQNRLARSAEETAEGVASALREQFSGLTIHSKGVDGAPAEVMVSEAEKLDANIVVVGNKRVQSAARVLGTIAGAVARDVKCDLYIANTHQR